MTKPTTEEIKDSIIEELEALVDKLPWWQSALIGAGMLAVIIAAFLACVAAKAACVGVTGGLAAPACLLAFLKCLLAVLGLIIALVLLIVKIVAVNGEDSAIEAKMEQLKTLQQQQEGG